MAGCGRDVARHTVGAVDPAADRRCGVPAQTVAWSATTRARRVDVADVHRDSPGAGRDVRAWAVRHRLVATSIGRPRDAASPTADRRRSEHLVRSYDARVA